MLTQKTQHRDAVRKIFSAIAKCAHLVYDIAEFYVEVTVRGAKRIEVGLTTILLILAAAVLFVPQPASCAETYAAAVQSDSPNAWKQIDSYGLSEFWTAINTGNVPDVAFHFLGVRYRRVEIDLNGNGVSDFIALLDEHGDYGFYTVNGDTTFHKVTLGLDRKEQPYYKGREMLLKGVDRRIFLDNHENLWQPDAGFDPATTPPQMAVQGRSRNIALHMTVMPAESAKDEARSLKPIRMPTKRLSIEPGKEAVWNSGQMMLSDDLLDEGRPPIPTTVLLHGFLLRVKMPEGNEKTLLQLSGTIVLGKNPTRFFCALLTLGNSNITAATVPLTDGSGDTEASIFIEVLHQPEK